MRKISEKKVVGYLLFGVILGVAAVSRATIVGSAHDFSDATWTSDDRICLPCHTPHNANMSVDDSPLWNHEVTSAVYTVYGSDTLQAIPGQPTGVSKLCLSCHDGTVALDAFGTNPTYNETISDRFLLGTDLSNDHPVSFTYDSDLVAADGGLFEPTGTAVPDLGGTISETMLFGNNKDQLECASCHDVHNAYNNDFLLLVDNSKSALCLTCHNK